MKTIFFTSLYLLNFFNCFCQNNKKGFHLSDIKPNEISLGLSKYPSPAHNHITDLKVIDARFDSTSFGLYQNYPAKYYSIVAAKNVTDEIGLFLKNYLQVEKINSHGGKSIIVVLKKLWLTNDLQENLETKHAGNLNGPGGVMAKLEFYCNSGEDYTPLYRFDTAYAGMENMKREAEDFIRDVLIHSVQKLKATDLTNISSTGKKMSLHEVILYSKQPFDIPIITAGIYKKGVYKTFYDFKMNNPSSLNYELKNGKLTKTIFLKDDQGEYPARDLWGYCDGSHLYISSADNYFELIKKENTFISIAARSLSRKESLKLEKVIILGLIAGGVGRDNKKITYNLALKLYELDMDTGELY